MSEPGASDRPPGPLLSQGWEEVGRGVQVPFPDQSAGASLKLFLAGGGGRQTGLGPSGHNLGDGGPGVAMKETVA